MTLEEIRTYCAAKPGTMEDYPFDDVTLVFKIGGKMYGLCNIKENPVRMNLKCDPELITDLRDSASGIIPGYHMNKNHWNTVIDDGSVDDEKWKWMIDHSYDLVFSKLPKREREKL